MLLIGLDKYMIKSVNRQNKEKGGKDRRRDCWKNGGMEDQGIG